MSEILIEYRWKNGALVVTSQITSFRVAIVGEMPKARAAAFLELSDVSDKPNTKQISERVWDNFLRGAY